MVKHNTIRVVLAHVVIAQWPIRQIDVNNAFLNGDSEENVYMQKPSALCHRILLWYVNFIRHFMV